MARSPAARALAVIIVAAILIRVGLLWVSVGRPEFAWADPDNYWARARRFVADGEWRWTMEAVHFQWGFFKAPLYPVFLSLFVPLGGSARWTVAVVQAVMGSLSLVCIFAAGRFVHSNRAGLLAAGAFAVLLTQSTKLVVFWQEHVYVPLIAFSFACLAFACTRAWRPAVWPFVCAGASFGVAALTRSMPLYFVPAAGVLWWARGPDRRTRAIEASVFVAAFAAVVTPYSMLVSSSVGRPVPIENVGSYLLLREDAAARRAPELSAALESVWTDFAASPRAFLADKTRLLLWGNFRPPTDGPLGSWVRTLGPLETRRQASALEWAVRLFGDLPIMIAMLLAPIGWVLVRDRPSAMMLGAWIPVHLGCSTLAGYGGHRFREPIEPLLFVFAAVVCAGGWRRVGLPAVIAAACVSLVVAVPLFDRLGATLNARVDYGVHGWKTTEAGRETTVEGNAGFLLEARDGRIVVTFRKLDAQDPDHVDVDVSTDGGLEQTVAVGPDPVRVDWSTNGQPSVFVTIAPRGGAAPPSLAIVVIEPPPGGA